MMGSGKRIAFIEPEDVEDEIETVRFVMDQARQLHRGGPPGLVVLGVRTQPWPAQSRGSGLDGRTDAHPRSRSDCFHLQVDAQDTNHRRNLGNATRIETGVGFMASQKANPKCCGTSANSMPQPGLMRLCF
jgi:hypothetical protein